MLVNRNPATVRKASDATRGRTGARNASQATPPSTSRNPTADSRFTCRVVIVSGVSRSSTIQIESQSIGRVRFSSKNRSQDCGQARYTGRLTAAQTATAAVPVRMNSLHRRSRRHNIISGNSSTAG